MLVPLILSLIPSYTLVEPSALLLVQLDSSGFCPRWKSRVFWTSPSFRPIPTHALRMSVDNPFVIDSITHAISMENRCRHDKVGRPPKPVITAIVNLPEKFELIPKKSIESVLRGLTEIEALKLVELEELTYEEAAVRMKVSRNTVWRLAEKAWKNLHRPL